MKFLITAGPTREPIDPVRYLSNRSSGKMGFALASAAEQAGHEVVLISGPVALPTPEGVQRIDVTTAEEMFNAVHTALPGTDIAILAAAVADFRPATVAVQKIKKQGAPQATQATLSIDLVPTRDILASLGAMQPRPFLLAGFAAETENLAANAQKKLHGKNSDFIIANAVNLPSTGFDSDENEVTIFSHAREPLALPKASKQAISSAIVELLVAVRTGGHERV